MSILLLLYYASKYLEITQIQLLCYNYNYYIIILLLYKYSYHCCKYIYIFFISSQLYYKIFFFEAICRHSPRWQVKFGCIDPQLLLAERFVIQESIKRQKIANCLSRFFKYNYIYATTCRLSSLVDRFCSIDR